ncbi:MULTISPECIES: MCE family protein [Gordonia]|uniref:Mce family protein n=2 Tax=Gordonia TaxID=2053 RepID=L7LE95_9ACTN|nr:MULTISPECIES: MlaD family protein [Gordonia]AUH69960.1 MCE family protein [Gordonia sp. YC-JH1]KXT57161.1 mammalian cell entry protein [Gordonia sp. QH-12]MBY4570024.1 mammalian cell entry protein [Gordonia sihwensis]WFN93361.1 MlaD family protein [Gordonia sihwensis]GAC59224.1 Mce family protein [Gordonia sihwensis NBRC 108236]
MTSRLVKIQLIVFVVIGVLAIVYVGAKYARLDKLVGVSTYKVTLHMPDASGIFTNAEVTYRGVPVGLVGDMKMVPNGVDVTLDMNSGAPKVPASAQAVLANRSAIGEQFIDLQPKTSAGPYLENGSRIQGAETPPKLQDVIADTISLTKTIPVDQLSSVIRELGTAFNGKGEDLTHLISSLDKLSKDGVRNIEPITQLLQNSNVVLSTQADQSDEILAWSKNLDRVSAQLVSSDPAIRRILTNGPPAGTALSTFLQDNGADTTKLIHQLGGTVHAAAPASFATGATFAMLSALSAGSHSAAPGDGQIHFGIVLETGNPVSCTKGYESTWAMIAEMKKRNPNFDVNYDDFPFNTKANCNVPEGNPTSVRGANRAALANPYIAQPWDNTPKKDPDKLNLNPLATQLAALMGVHPK